jgi:hypothetical protein
VQNLEASTSVTCDYTFYTSTGTQAYTSGQSSPIAPGDSLFVYVPSIPSSQLGAGSYSGVVGCTGKVAAVANFSDADSGASFNGVSSAAPVWYTPGLYDNYFNYYSTVVVQNASGSPVNITLEVFAPGSSTAVKTYTANAVPAYASVSFEQEGAAELADNQPYSGKITATGGNVAPVVTIYGKGPTANQLYSYNPFQNGGQTFYTPVLMKNYYGYSSAIVVQNMGNAATDVTVSYSTGQSQTASVGAGAAWSIFIPSQGPASLPSGPSGLFSATITSSSQNVAVLVNESNSYNRAASFDGFAAGSNTVQVPVLEKRYFNYNSSVTCQVLSGGPAPVSIQYFDNTGTKGTTTSGSIANGQSVLFYQPAESFLTNGWIGSAKITSTASIACVVNQDMNEGSYATTSMDQLFAYEGVAP